MSKLYLYDQNNITFVPKTCEEAVVLFHRLEKHSGLAFWDRLPETLVNLSKMLPPPEQDKFHEWVLNPYEVKPAEEPGYFEQLDSSVVGKSQAKEVVSEAEFEDDEKLPESFCPEDHTDNNRNRSEFCSEHECNDPSQATPANQPE